MVETFCSMYTVETNSYCFVNHPLYALFASHDGISVHCYRVHAQMMSEEPWWNDGLLSTLFLVDFDRLKSNLDYLGLLKLLVRRRFIQFVKYTCTLDLWNNNNHLFHSNIKYSIGVVRELIL